MTNPRFLAIRFVAELRSGAALIFDLVACQAAIALLLVMAAAALVHVPTAAGLRRAPAVAGSTRCLPLLHSAALQSAADFWCLRSVRGRGGDSGPPGDEHAAHAVARAREHRHEARVSARQESAGRGRAFGRLDRPRLDRSFGITRATGSRWPGRPGGASTATSRPRSKTCSSTRAWSWSAPPPRSELRPGARRSPGRRGGQSRR